MKQRIYKIFMAGLFISLFIGCKTEVDAPAAGKPDNNTNNGNNKKIVHIYEEISYNSDNVIQSRNVYKNDENGNLVNKIVYNEDGSIRNEYIYKYENNLLIKTLYYDEIDQGPTYFTYEYDQNGNIIYEITNNTSDNTRKKLHKYVYNDKNQLVKEIYFESGIDDETDPDNISNICEYTYDENGNIKTDESLSGKIEFVYDKNGNKTEAIYKYANGTQFRHTTFEYNPKLNSIEEISYNDEFSRLDYKYMYFYDLNGNEIIQISFNTTTNIMNSYFKESYNENGDITSASYYNEYGKLQNYTIYNYEYFS